MCSYFHIYHGFPNSFFFLSDFFPSAYFLTILQIPHSSCQPGLQDFPNKPLLKVVINSTFITLKCYHIHIKMIKKIRVA